MKETYVSGLIPGAAVSSTFLVRIKERKTARNGNAYLDLELQDSTGIVRAKLWDCDGVELDFEVDDVVRVAGRVESFQNTPQLSIRKVTRCQDSEVYLPDYLPHTPHDVEVIYAGLLNRIQQMPAGPLRQMLLSIFEDSEIARKFKLAPAAMSLHHAYLGGLAEHVASLVQLADSVCDHYPSLQREWVLAGLLLHDLGKIEELTFDRRITYSTRGQLMGHIIISLEIVHEKMRAIPDFPPDLRDRLEHIILSHHGKLEFGSPKEPLFMEALVVHYLDDLDSKLAAIREQYAADENRPGVWTVRNRALGRELLKPPAQPKTTEAAALKTEIAVAAEKENPPKLPF